MRTNILVTAALLVAGVTGVLPTALATATCETAEPVASSDTRAGVAPEGTSHWYNHLASGTATYVLTPAAGTDVDLFVYSDNCSSGWLCDSQNEGSATDSCTVGGEANYRVEVYGYEGAGGYTISFSGSPQTQCSDRVDNDADGHVDYPADPGCSSYTDTAEAAGCPETAPGVVVCLDPSTTFFEQPVTLVTVVGGSDNIEGYLDVYRFTIAGVTTTLPCVTLRVDGGEVSPCALAGGTFVSRSGTLVSQPEPGIGPLPVATVRICHAELTATVFGFGVNSAEAYTVC